MQIRDLWKTNIWVGCCSPATLLVAIYVLACLGVSDGTVESLSEAAHTQISESAYRTYIGGGPKGSILNGSLMADLAGASVERLFVNILLTA
jgi:hypothetical protein